MYNPKVWIWGSVSTEACHFQQVLLLLLGFLTQNKLQSIKWVPSVLWYCWLGIRKGIRPVKKTERWGAGMVICLELGADLHMARLMPLTLTVSCFSKIQIGFTFLVLAYPGSPGKGPLNGCVCVCKWVFTLNESAVAVKYSLFNGCCIMNLGSNFAENFKCLGNLFLQQVTHDES